MKFNKKITNWMFLYYITLTIVFVYIFIQFLTMKRTNAVYKFYTDYIMNKYCIILYILLVILIMQYDNYTAILLFILVMVPFRFAFKEYFITTSADTSTPSPTSFNINDPLIQSEYLGKDDRFKMDDIAKNEILRQIKAQVDFDPYKTNLSKNVIYDIYNKYFDNDIFVKLKNINDDSKQYIAEGNFKYVPENNKVDYDLVSYQNLTDNTQMGNTGLTDGISNKTKINR